MKNKESFIKLRDKLKKYNKEYYSDKDLRPSENLFFKISILPFGGFNSPNLRWF